MRPDLEIIQKWIEPESRVLDLGCGDGALLTFLGATKKVKGIGLEIDTSNIQYCVAVSYTHLTLPTTPYV